MAAGSHIIHRQLIDIRVSDKAEAQRWQNEFSTYYKSTVLPALEKACDELCQENDQIRINKLELDIGKISRGGLRPALTQELVKKFKEEILKVASEKLYLVGETELRSKQALPGGVSVISGKTASLYDTVIYYLEYGMLPWWSSAKDFSIHKGVDQLLGENSEKLPGRQFFEKLRTLLTRKHCQLRVIDVCTGQQLIHCFDPRGKYALQKLYNDFKKLDSRRSAKYTFFRQILTHAVADASGQEFMIDREKAIRNMLKELGYPVEQPVVLQLKIKEKAGADSYLMQVYEQCLKEKAIRPASETGTSAGKEDLGATGAAQEKNDRYLKPHSHDKASEGGKTDVFNHERDRTSIPFSLHTDETIEIANAGVVLLWPYLHMFFRELKLVESGNFIDEASQEKAVQLLHYLVNGDAEAEEHQWLLFKLLCGMEPTDFVPTTFEPDASEKKECDNLLRSVIRNWAVLKSTSPAGLQVSFLRRPGLLKQDHNGWVVHVERIAIDVLLDRLTWPISVIRLPWSKNVIHVKW